MNAFRTLKGADQLLRFSDFAFVGLMTWLVPAVFGALIALGATLWQSTSQNYSDGAAVIGMIGGLLLMAPLVTIFIVPVSLLVGAWARRLGWAGWGMAALIAAFGPIPIVALYASAEPDPLRTLAVYSGAIAVPALLHAAVMWSALRWKRPDVLAPR